MTPGEDCESPRPLWKMWRMTKNQMLREASAEYEKQFAEGQMLLDLAEKRIDELKALILGAYPDAKFEIFRLGPKDYRLNAAIDAKSFSG